MSEDMLDSLQQIAEEISNPTEKTVNRCLKFIGSYPFNNFSATRNKQNIDYLTYFFDLLFSGVPEAGARLQGYEKLIKLNEELACVDYRHLGKRGNIHEKAALLCEENSQPHKAALYREKKRVFLDRIKKSDELFLLGTGKHLHGKVESAVKDYQASLDINPYNSQARVMLGAIYSLRVVAAEVQGTHREEDYSSFCWESIPLLQWQKEEDGSIRVDLGVNYQAPYYKQKKNWRELSINFLCEKFGESKNEVFRYVRDFSEGLKWMMAKYYRIFKRSAFKFYGENYLYALEIMGLYHFSESSAEVIIPSIINKEEKLKGSYLELRLIEGQSMYELFRELEKGVESGSYSREFSTAIEEKLIDKHLSDLASIQGETQNIRKEMGDCIDFETSDYLDKLRTAFFEEEAPQEGKEGGLITLLDKHFKLAIDYPAVLDTLGKKLNKIVNKRKDRLVIYKDSSPRNTKINLRGVLQELGMRGEAEKATALIFEKFDEKNGLDLVAITQAYANNLYQLDFEKIYRLSSQFDDLIEMIEFPFFNPGRNGEEKWSEKYDFFLERRGNNGMNKGLKEEYLLFSLNRNVRWLYYLMKWYNRVHDDKKKQEEAKEHLEDLLVHVDNCNWVMDKLEDEHYQGLSFGFDELNGVVEKIREGIQRRWEDSE